VVALQQFSITVPALAAGYTAAALRTKINQLRTARGALSE
jgi:hypothetical protein